MTNENFLKITERYHPERQDRDSDSAHLEKYCKDESSPGFNRQHCFTWNEKTHLVYFSAYY